MLVDSAGCTPHLEWPKSDICTTKSITISTPGVVTSLSLIEGDRRCFTVIDGSTALEVLASGCFKYSGFRQNSTRLLAGQGETCMIG